MKRKLTKRALIGNGLLLLIALVSVAARQVGSSSANDSSSTQPLSFDTVLLKLNGASETDLLSAPCISMNKQAASYVKKYLASNSEDLQAIKSKSVSYFKITDAVFSKYGLPQELKYLAVVESELNTKALSHVGARGAWQLMPETARLLSLKVTRKNDERTHFFKSTVAAAKYLRDLHAIFNDWLLVIASYNSGPGKVMDAIKKSGSRNFWKLQNFLPAETRGHVKRFVATHYFFEGRGSVTTVTREEAITYKKTMLAFVEGLKVQREKATASEIATNNAPVKNDVIVKAEIPVDSKIANRE